MYITYNKREDVMATNSILNEYKAFQAKNAEDANTVSKAAAAIRDEYTNSCFVKKSEPVNDRAMLVSQVTRSIKSISNAPYKSSTSLEPPEIEHIKDCLNNYACSDEKTAEFKKEIITDLNNFQKQIKEKHYLQIAEFTKKQQFCEKQIRVYEFEKNKLIMDRLSKISWPYDEKTKEYDNKIASLQIQAQQYAQRALAAQQMRPAANGKDLLLYQMQLKEKYSA